MTGNRSVNRINIILKETPVLRSVYFFHVYVKTRAYFRNICEDGNNIQIMIFQFTQEIIRDGKGGKV